jgi:hypothetical protein
LSVAATIACVFGILLFGALGTCGAFTAIEAWGSVDQIGIGIGIRQLLLIINIPLFFIGFGGMIWCLVILIRGKKKSKVLPD